MPRIDIQVPRFVWWRLTFLVAMVVGLAAENYPRPGFWSSYVFDIAGPVWAYILCRGLYYPTLVLLGPSGGSSLPKSPQRSSSGSVFYLKLVNTSVCITGISTRTISSRTLWA